MDKVKIVSIGCGQRGYGQSILLAKIEDYDLVNRIKWIERRQVARIVHDTLRIEMNEKDEGDWTAAKEMSDLYSCRTCVQHISQVYIKGIVDPEKPNVFNHSPSYIILCGSDLSRMNRKYPLTSMHQ